MLAAIKREVLFVVLDDQHTRSKNSSSLRARLGMISNYLDLYFVTVEYVCDISSHFFLKIFLAHS